MRLILALFVGVWLPGLVHAQPLTEGMLTGQQEWPVLSSWVYSPHAAPDLQTLESPNAAGASLDATLPPGSLPGSWEGHGWFHHPVQAHGSFVGTPLGIQIQHFGPVALFLDGVPVSLENGTGSDSAISIWNPFTYRNDGVAQSFTLGTLVLPDTAQHWLTVHLTNPDAERLHQVGYNAGFSVRLGDPDALALEWATTVHGTTGLQWGLPIAYNIFALLHLFLFFFYPRIRENLYFAVVGFCISLIVFLNYQEAYFYQSARELIFIRRFWSPLTILTVLALLRFVYAIYLKRLPRHFYVLAGVGAILAIVGWLNPRLGWFPVGGRTYVYAFALLINIEMLRVAAYSILWKREGPIVIALGVLAFVVAFGYPLSVVVGLLPPINLVQTLTFSFYVILVLLFAISLYLSRQFAQTNRALEQRIVEIETLSRQKLEHERKAQQDEVQRLQLEAAYQQKVQELEEARQLQLSMLPHELPSHHAYDVAAFMQTATEVGGDYYDFAEDEDGALTIAVGDATGHGLKAGTMVTATKSLFKLLGEDQDLLSIFSRSTRALKRMNLRSLYMALTLARFSNGSLQLATAGMPATLIWRAATQEMETVLLKGMPLGSFPSFPYQETSLKLAPGDIVLFMSDGFPELFNAAREMLGYDEAAVLFQRVVQDASSAKAVVDGLVSHLRAWAGDQPPDDDVTFVVVRKRTP